MPYQSANGLHVPPRYHVCPPSLTAEYAQDTISAYMETTSLLVTSGDTLCNSIVEHAAVSKYQDNIFGLFSLHSPPGKTSDFSLTFTNGQIEKYGYQHGTAEYNLSFGLCDLRSWNVNKRCLTLSLLINSPTFGTKTRGHLDAVDKFGRLFGDEIERVSIAIVTLKINDQKFFDLFHDWVFTKGHNTNEISEHFLNSLAANLHRAASLHKSVDHDVVMRETLSQVKAPVDSSVDYRWCPCCGKAMADPRSLQNHLDLGKCDIHCETCDRANTSMEQWLECVEAGHEFFCSVCHHSFTAYLTYHRHHLKGMCQPQQPLLGAPSSSIHPDRAGYIDHPSSERLSFTRRGRRHHFKSGGNRRPTAYGYKPAH